MVWASTSTRLLWARGVSQNKTLAHGQPFFFLIAEISSKFRNEVILE